MRDGFELLAEIRSDDPNCPSSFVPVIIPAYKELEKSEYMLDLFI